MKIKAFSLKVFYLENCKKFIGYMHRINELWRNITIVFFVFLSIIVLTECEKDKNNFKYDTCYQGVVIGFEECLESTLIQLHGIDYGETIVFHDKQKGDIEYNNVIKSPGIFPIGNIFIITRKYNAESDYNLFNPVPQPCQAVYGTYETPIVVITNYSQTKCP